MATTLFQATLDLARAILYYAEGTATGGTTLTLIDNPTRTEPADFWNGGTIWHRDPVHNVTTSKVITDYALTTWTITWAGAITAVVAGDAYTIATNQIPRGILQRSVNQALSEIGNITQENVALTTVADQEDYTLPAGVYNVVRVEIATATAAPYYYVPHFNWEELPTTGELRFDTGREPGDTGYIIRLFYNAPLAELTTDAGSISSYIHPERLKWEAAVQACQWRFGFDKSWQDKLAQAIAMREIQRREHPIIRMDRDPHYSL